jgi:hypothetical protein
MSSNNRQIKAAISADFRPSTWAVDSADFVFSGHNLMVSHDSKRFSTVFSTGVENFGERPKAHGITAAGKGLKKDADCNTLPCRLTPSEASR